MRTDVVHLYVILYVPQMTFLIGTETTCWHPFTNSLFIRQKLEK